MDMPCTERKQHEFSFFDIVNDIKMASDSPPNGRVPGHVVHPKVIQTDDSEACSEQEPRHNGKDTEHVVICSEEMVKEAEVFSHKLTSRMKTCRIITSTDKSTFDEEHLPLSSFTTLYLFIDLALATTMLRKGRLHNSVYDFFDAVDEAKKLVFVVNKFDKKDRMYNEIFYQLPGGCTKEMKDILVTTKTRQPEADMIGLDSNSDSDSDSESEVCSTDPKANSQDRLDVNNVTDAPQMPQDVNAKKLEALSLVEDTKKPAGSPSVNCMIGSHCTMNITPSNNQLVITRQDGSENIVNIQIVPSSETSKLVIIMTTDPNSPELEELLVQEIDAKKEVLNIRLKSSDAQIVSVKKGSVIIEIEVKPGQIMNPEWIDGIVKTILPRDVRTVIPDGTKLNLDIESKLVMPIEALGKMDLGQSYAALEHSQKDKEGFPVPVDELTRTLESAINFGIKSTSGDDYTDTAISLLDVLADLNGEDAWAYAIRHPRLFSVGGIFYRQVERDIGLSPEKHFQLPSFPEKFFLFNDESHNIELCADPHGHYPIGPDIEIRIHNKTPAKRFGKAGRGRGAKPESKRIKQNIRGKSPQKHEKIVEIPEVEFPVRDEIRLLSTKFEMAEEMDEIDSGLSDITRLSDLDVSMTKLLNQDQRPSGKEKSIQTDSGLSDVY